MIEITKYFLRAVSGFSAKRGEEKKEVETGGGGEISGRFERGETKLDDRKANPEKSRGTSKLLNSALVIVAFIPRIFVTY